MSKRTRGSFEAVAWAGLVPCLAVLLPGAIAMLSPAVAAGDPPPPAERLKSIEREIKESQQKEETLKRKESELNEDMTRLKTKLVEAARKQQAYENRVSTLQSTIGALNEREAQKRAALGDRRRELARLLAIVARLARHPPEALVALPTTPADTIRTAILLRAAVPPLHSQSNDLTRELASLVNLRAEIARQHADVSQAQGSLERQRAQIEAMLDQKAELQQELSSDLEKHGRHSRELAAQAKDLKDLMVRLEEDRRARAAKSGKGTGKSGTGKNVAPGGERHGAPGNGGESLSAARGTLALPVQGRLLRRFGESTEFGTASRGIALATRPHARVVAPFAGEVVFAGPFRGYGQTLIIAHGEGYHTVLSGLSRIDGVVGQTLVAGEPVGVMGEGDDGEPTLYVEMRRNGDPINPLPWLAAGKDMVHG